MKPRTIIVTLLITFVTIWFIGIIVDYDELSTKTPNPEYQKYISLQKQKLNELIAQAGDEGKIAINENAAIRTDKCIGSNFEGAEVKLAGIQVYDSIYRTKTVKPYYTYNCNGAILDPDHPVYGLPDIEIAVGPVTYFEPELSGIESLINFGFSKKPKPHKIYRKPLFDSTGTQHKFFEMQLWLTTFKVVITVIADRDKPQVESDDASMRAKIYPGIWYKDTRKLISMNDLEHKDEYKNHLYSDITFVLEINPNASPWYIKTDNLQTKQPDIAVGAVICKEILKQPKDENRIHLQTLKGMVTPLYYEPFEQNENIENSAEQFKQIENQLTNYTNFDIWNKKYYIKLYSKNIGSRQTGFFGQKKFDEQVEYTFILPLLVVGSWDVQMPWDVMPEMEAPKPYYKNFSIKNLLPKWGLGFGKGLSAVMIITIIGLAFLLFIPKFRR